MTIDSVMDFYGNILEEGDIVGLVGDNAPECEYMVTSVERKGFIGVEILKPKIGLRSKTKIRSHRLRKLEPEELI